MREEGLPESRSGSHDGDRAIRRWSAREQHVGVLRQQLGNRARDRLEVVQDAHVLEAERLCEPPLGRFPREIREGRPAVRNRTGHRDRRARDPRNLLLLDEGREQRLETRVCAARQPTGRDRRARASRQVEHREVGLGTADVGG